MKREKVVHDAISAYAQITSEVKKLEGKQKRLKKILLDLGLSPGVHVAGRWILNYSIGSDKRLDASLVRAKLGPQTDECYVTKGTDVFSVTRATKTALKRVAEGKNPVQRKGKKK
jgi:hypothetical protein